MKKWMFFLIGCFILAAILFLVKNLDNSEPHKPPQKIPKWIKASKPKTSRPRLPSKNLRPNTHFKGRVRDETDPLESVNVNISLIACDKQELCKIFEIAWEKDLTYKDIDTLLESVPFEVKEERMRSYFEENEFPVRVSFVSGRGGVYEGDARLAPGSYRLEVCHPGYKEYKRDERIPPSDELKEIELQDIELKKFEGTCLTVIVKSPNGTPVPGTKVSIGRNTHGQRILTGLPTEEADKEKPAVHFSLGLGIWGRKMTNLQGQARFVDTEPGEDWIIEAMGVKDDKHEEATCFYGLKTGVVVEKGTENKETVYMDFSPAITGTVRWRDKTLASGVLVIILKCDSRGNTVQERSCYTNEKGSFKIWGLRGEGKRYLFIQPITKKDKNGKILEQYYGFKEQFYYQDSPLHLDIVLGSHGGQIFGYVYEAALTNGVPEVISPLEDIEVKAATFPHRRWMSTKTNKDGYFSIEGLGTEGKVVVSLQNPRDFQVIGGLRQEPIEGEIMGPVELFVMKGSTKGELILILEPSNRIINLELKKKGDWRPPFKAGFICRDGRYSIPDLDEGEYHLKVSNGTSEKEYDLFIDQATQELKVDF